MNITVFTSNQPRHLALLRKCSEIADNVYAVQECTTVHPGRVKDRYDNSEVMRKYFDCVQAAEASVFGEVGFLPSNVHQLAIRSGDLEFMPIKVLTPALQSDYYIVFGSSFIKGDLIHFLMEHHAVNIHMGVSPYYRGASCNFWAMFEGHPELVGATIHLLSEKLDAGDILYHAMPKPEIVDPFVLGMKAVSAAQESIVERIMDGQLKRCNGEAQDRKKELRYSRNADFCDAVAENYLLHLPTPEEVFFKLSQRDYTMLKDTFIPE